MKAILSGRMPVVCMNCGDTYASKPCEPHLDGVESHGCCTVCFPAVLAGLGIKFSCRLPASKPLDALPSPAGAARREAAGER